MSKNHPELQAMPHVRQTPGLESYMPRTIVDGVKCTPPAPAEINVYALINAIPAALLYQAEEALEARTKPPLSIEELKTFLTGEASDLAPSAEGLREELEDELRELAESRATEDAAEAIENGDLDEFLYDLAYNTIWQEVQNNLV